MRRVLDLQSRNAVLERALGHVDHVVDVERAELVSQDLGELVGLQGVVQAAERTARRGRGLGGEEESVRERTRLGAERLL